MQFTKATLLLTNLLLLSVSVYWTTKTWLTHTSVPTHEHRSCTLLSKRLRNSRSRYRTEFTVSLHLLPLDPPAKPPVIAYRYATPAYNQTLPQARAYISKFKLGKNYTCFIDAPPRGATTTPYRYSISMTRPGYSSQVWLATLFTCVALACLLLQLSFLKGVPVAPIVGSVTPPPRAGLSSERVRELCEECEVEECAICLEEEGGDRGARLPCGHAFHGTCLERWLVRGRVCPLCNCDLGEEGMMHVKVVGMEEGSVGAGDGVDMEPAQSGVGRRKSRQRDSVELD